MNNTQPWTNLKTARKQAFLDLKMLLVPIVEKSLNNQIPVNEWKKTKNLSENGIKKAIYYLTKPALSKNKYAKKSHDSDFLEDQESEINPLIFYSVFDHYIEPPESKKSNTISQQERKELRWTASLIARFVRSEIEDIHAFYNTKQEEMPNMNRSLRNNCFDYLIDNTSVSYHLSHYPRMIFNLKCVDIQIPHIVGD